jgi:hypothetical protein
MVENMVINRKNNRQQLLQQLWGIGFPEVGFEFEIFTSSIHYRSGGKSEE